MDSIVYAPPIAAPRLAFTPLMSSSKAAADDEPMWLQLSGALVQVARVTASLDLVV